jgi:hypothetical protein
MLRVAIQQPDRIDVLVHPDTFDPQARPKAQGASANPGDEAGATLIRAKKRPKLPSRVYSNVRKAGREVVSTCVIAAHAAEGRLRKKVDKVVVRVEHACLETGLRALQTLKPTLNGKFALGPSTSVFDAETARVKQQLDVDTAYLRTQKKSFKKARTKLKAARQKLGRMGVAADKHRTDARSHLEKDSAHLCRMLPVLALGQARKDNGQGPGVLQAAMQKGKEAMGLASEPTREDAIKALDRLWDSGLDEARASAIKQALDKLYADIDPGVGVDETIAACRTLLDRGQALRRESSPDPTEWNAALLEFNGTHAEPWQAVLDEKKLLDGLPNPGKQAWVTDLATALKLTNPSAADIKHFIKSHVGRSLRGLSDDAFDDVCRTVAPGGYIGTILMHTDRVKSADVLEAWRDATAEERVRRYEIDPIHTLAELTESIESNAIQGMSDGGLAADQVPLPNQQNLYLNARDAVHRLLRGMCLSTRGQEGRTSYLSRVIFERATPEDRDSLLRNTTWKEPAVFQQLMDRMLRITRNADLMGSQYQRLLQEMQVLLQGNVLAAVDTRAHSGWRRSSDYDHLEGALPAKSRGALRRAWDKVKFWGGYFTVSNSVEMEAARFAYHQSHVNRRLRTFVELMSRNSVNPREVRQAYRDFLSVADDLRAEFDARQFPDTACDEYLRLEFSHAVGRLGRTAIKRLYQHLKQPCPDMCDAASPFPRFAGVQAWWRNKFVDEHHATPRDSVSWQRAAHRSWNDLRNAVEQEPEARTYAYQLEGLASRFSRNSGKDYEGMKSALDGIIKSDGSTWASPGAGTFTAYDAAWSRINPSFRQKLLDRLDRYAHRMDDFLKGDDVTRTIAEENRFMYRYFLEGLLESGRTFTNRNPMNRYGESGVGVESTEPAENPRADVASTSAPALASTSASTSSPTPAFGEVPAPAPVPAPASVAAYASVSA